MTQRAKLMLLLILIVSGISVIAYLKGPREITISNGSPKDSQHSINTDPEIGSRSTNLATVPVSEIPLELQNMYRLAIDRRIVKSIENLPTLVRSVESAGVRAEFSAAGKWVVTLGNQGTVELSEYPDFSEYERLITTAIENNQAANVLRQKINGKGTSDRKVNVLKEQCTSLSAAKIFQVLQNLDQIWANQSEDPEILKSAARCYAFLALQSPLDNQFADEVVAQSLAVVYLTRFLTGQELSFERSILAAVLGYRGDALRVVSLAGKEKAKIQIGEKDLSALVAYLSFDSASLQKLLKQGPTDSLATFLALQDRNVVETAEDWTSLANRITEPEPLEFNAPSWLIESGLRLNKFELNGKLPAAMNSAVRAELERFKNLEVTKSQSFSLYHELDKLILSTGGQISGFIVNPKVFSSFFQSRIHDSAYKTAVFLLFQYGDPQSASQFSSKALSPWMKEQPAALALYNWLNAFLPNSDPKKNRQQLLSSVADQQYLSADAWRSVVNVHARFFRDRAGQKLVPVEMFAKSFDSRPKHRRLLAEFLASFGYDLKVRNKLFRSLLSTESQDYPSDDYIWWTAIAGTDIEINSLLSKPKLSPDLMVSVLSSFKAAKVFSKEEYENKLRELLKRYPTEWTVIEAFVLHCLKLDKNHQDAIDVVTRWLSKYKAHDMRYITAVNYLTSSYLRLGDEERAWKENEKVFEGFQGHSVMNRIVLLIRKNDLKRAQEIAELSEQRYGDDLVGILPAIRIFWADRKFTEAAQKLESWVNKHPKNDWAPVLAENFLYAFKSAPDSDRIEALRELTKTNIFPMNWFRFPDEYAEREDFETAFELLQAMNVPPGELTVKWLFSGYDYLKKARGKESAVAWIKSKLPSKRAVAATIEIYNSGDYELLWELIDDAHANEFVWLPRAMALMDPSWESSPYRTKVVDYYRSGGKGDYFECGAYLLDLIPKEDFIKGMNSDSARVVKSYYLGLREEARGNFSEAHDWYRVAVELDNLEKVESAWSIRRLYAMGNDFKLRGKL